MPANLSPEYKTAEAAFRRTRDPREQLDLLREMLRTIPKHKGTEHLQADIKTRIKELTDALAGPKKTGVRGGPPTTIPPEGAAQVALIGPPNTGKSTLHDHLTGSHAQTGPYPFTTQYPQPGMLPYEDVHIQLVDLPPISTEHPIPWIGNAVQSADAALLVVDLCRPGCLEQVMNLHEILAERKVMLGSDWSGKDEDDDPFTRTLPAVLVVTKADEIDDVDAEVEVFRELTGYDYPVVAVSAETGSGLDDLGAWLFDHLGIVRVYTKVPGKPPDMGRPFTVRRGDTVIDVAVLVHRDIAATFQYARVWGEHTFDGQQVGRDHQLEDGDVLEIHA